MKVTLMQATPNPIKTIAKITSICYDSALKNSRCENSRIIYNTPCCMEV